MYRKVVAGILRLNYLFIILMCISMLCDAEGINEFDYEVDNNEAVICYYLGDSSVVEIPSEIDGYPVTGICHMAFWSDDNLTEVIIPDSVKEIGDHAFYECNNLKRVVIGAGIEEMGENVFYNCGQLTEVIIKDGVKCIGKGAFSECKSLSSLSLPQTITEIGGSAFSGCKSLHSIILPSSITAIESAVFAGCESLSEIKLPNEITKIGEDAFHGCESLAEIKLPSEITKIGEYAFSGCESLAEIKLPSEITTIENNTFYACVSLTKITIPDNVTIIGDYAFGVCYNLTTINMPSRLQFLGAGAFEDCDNLEFIALPDGIETVSDELFYGCDKLRSITIPDGVKSIGERAFGSCFNLNTISIPVSVSLIDDYAFSICFLQDVYYNGSKVNAAQIEVGEENYRLLNAEWHYTAAITSQPKNVTVLEGETAKVTLKATGDGLTYRWYYKNVGDSKYTYTSTFTGNSYSVKMSEARNGRRVLCKVSDKYGNTVQSNSVTINMKEPETVTITAQPKSVTVAEGKTATVSVKATGDGLTYRWYYKNAGDSKYTYTSTFKSNTYSVKMNAARNGRRVLCKVTDQYGNTVQSKSVTLNMAKPTVVITAQPKSVMVDKGAKASVAVTATGEGLTYQWYVCAPGKTTFVKSSLTGSTYSVTMKDTIDGRKVYCVVTDKYGCSVKSETAVLSMTPPVVITAQPKSVTVAAGEKATVTVSAKGDGLTYQWYVCAPGKTTFVKSAVQSASYSVTMKDSIDGRRVYCVITDTDGYSVQSKTVTLSMK